MNAKSEEITKLLEYINNQAAEINEIVAKYPKSIPVQVAAKYLGVEDKSLQASIIAMKCPFGFSWKKEGKCNNGYTVETLPFVLHQLNLQAFKTDVMI